VDTVPLGRLEGDVARGAIEGIGGIGERWPWLVAGRERLNDDFGREGVTAGLSDGKKLDLLLRGDGDGGT